MKYIVTNNMSINDTINKCNPGDVIYLKNGVYKEKVEILVDGIELIGESQEKTIITNKDFYHKIMPDFNECNTFRTYTLYVGSNNVKLSNLTIRNEATPSKKYGQAVALHADGLNFYCEKITLDSAQDTLFTGPLPLDLVERHKGFLRDPFRKTTPSFQIYKNCKIIGDVDFIFGCAQALFINCDIVSINRNSSSGPDGYICAPSHTKESLYGYLFYKCNLIKEDGVTDVFLGRPWRDYGTAAFIECNMDDHINPKGFDKWANTNRDKTARFYEYTENINLENREKWVSILTKDEADKYVETFIKFIGYKEN